MVVGEVTGKLQQHIHIQSVISVPIWKVFLIKWPVSVGTRYKERGREEIRCLTAFACKRTGCYFESKFENVNKKKTQCFLETTVKFSFRFYSTLLQALKFNFSSEFYFRWYIQIQNNSVQIQMFAFKCKILYGLNPTHTV